MTTKTSGTVLTEIQRKLCRRGVAKWVAAAKSVGLDLAQVEEDVYNLIRPTDTISTITDTGDIDHSSKILESYQKFRSRVTSKKVEISKAWFVWDQAWEDATGWLYQQDCVASLRNAELRNAAIRELLKPIQRRRDRASHLLEQLETMGWETKENQRALEQQIWLYKERRETASCG